MNAPPQGQSQLWRANPASGVVELVETAAGVPYEVRELLVVSDRLDVRAYEPSADWSLHQIDAAPGSTLSRMEGPAGMDPQGLSSLNGLLFYNAYATDAIGNWLGRELLRLDPQTGQIRALDLNPGSSKGDPRSLTALNRHLFILADGAGSGRVQKLGINPGNRSASPAGNPDGFADLHGTPCFSAIDDTRGWQLWRLRVN